MFLFIGNYNRFIKCCLCCMLWLPLLASSPSWRCSHPFHRRSQRRCRFPEPPWWRSSAAAWPPWAEGAVAELTTSGSWSRFSWRIFSLKARRFFLKQIKKEKTDRKGEMKEKKREMWDIKGKLKVFSYFHKLIQSDLAEFQVLGSVICM